ncbi:MAG: PTS sugar transporter subunit IIA [Treponema sp.]|jgi:mannitol/fructose-specific phosphotransferase system IIA component (Ntr-type)|nr:PTS sugar transporter subunit IIA [Treponema sp.]
MLLNEVFNKDSINLNLKSTVKESAFAELVDTIADANPALNREQMLGIIQARENKMNSAIISGVAIPHGCYPGINTVIGALGVSRNGIDYHTADKKPVHVVFMIIMGEGCRETHLRVLNRILALINSEVLEFLQKAADPQEVHHMLARFH